MTFRERSGANRPWSPLEIEQSITAIIESLDTLTCEMLALAMRAADLRHAYESAQARAWLTVAGDKATETVKRAIVATMETEFEGQRVNVGDLKYQSELADAVVNAKRSQQRMLEHQGDLLRTLMASHRASME